MSLGDGAWKVGGGLTQFKAKQGGIHGHTDLFTYLPNPLLTQTQTCQEGGWSGSEIP